MCEKKIIAFKRIKVSYAAIRTLSLLGLKGLILQLKGFGP
jgi:hypothetical protein